MRDEFYGHYPLTEDEDARIWAQASVVLDTNALLNMYRYSLRAREELRDALFAVQDRLWMPHQVGREFHSMRIALILEQLSIDKGVSSVLDDIENSTKSKLGKFRKNAFVAVDELVSQVVSAVAEARVKLHSAREERDRSYGISISKDPVLKQLAEFFHGRVGPGYSDSEMTEIAETADARYEKNVPPGYGDKAKKGNEKYGDYIIWRQMIDYAKKDEKDVIFVTDDGKEDWWWIVRHEAVGKTVLGPRLELRDEFRLATGRIFYMYTPEEFLKRLHEIAKTELSTEVVVEVRETSRETNRLEAVQSEREILAARLLETEIRRMELEDRMKMATAQVAKIRRQWQAVKAAESELARCVDRHITFTRELNSLSDRLDAIHADKDSSFFDETSAAALAEKEKRTLLALRDYELRVRLSAEDERIARTRFEEISGASYEEIQNDLALAEEELSLVSRERERAVHEYHALDQILDSIS